MTLKGTKSLQAVIDGPSDDSMGVIEKNHGKLLTLHRLDGLVSMIKKARVLIAEMKMSNIYWRWQSTSHKDGEIVWNVISTPSAVHPGLPQLDVPFFEASNSCQLMCYAVGLAVYTRLNTRNTTTVTQTCAVEYARLKA